MQTSKTKNEKIQTWIESCPSYFETGAAFLREMQEVLDGQATGKTHTQKFLTVTVEID
tara:strand:- start:92 stop:265 length:174 start_codon:yes stop_codon:yes gene_type:complete